MTKFLPPDLTWTTHCGDQPTFGRFSTMFDYPTKGITQASTYPKEACQPWLHYNMRLGNLAVDTSIQVGATGVYGGTVTAPTFIGNLIGTASGNKVSFDITHPRKPGKRIRHIVAEGPEPGIYVRGKLKDSNKIELPEYWEGLIDPDSITVTLTQIGYSQDLIVDSVDWGKVIKVRSGVGANINCFYEVWAARWLDRDNHDEKLQVVYDGESYDDYPGNNDIFWKLNETQNPNQIKFDSNISL
tara:strand:+ start:158 stop:886 length:729 start_codon:yes stop_codon:yes gene_type:complete